MIFYRLRHPQGGFEQGHEYFPTKKEAVDYCIQEKFPTEERIIERCYVKLRKRDLINEFNFCAMLG